MRTKTFGGRRLWFVASFERHRRKKLIGYWKHKYVTQQI